MSKGKLIPAALAGAAVAVASPALAQDDRSTNFDGPYASVFVGYGIKAGGGNSGLEFDTDRDSQFDDTVFLSSPPAAPNTNAFNPGFCDGIALTNTPAGGCRDDKNKVEFGARVGWDSRVSENFVVGALLEASTNRSRDGVAGYSTTPAAYNFDRQLDHAFSGRLRAGYTPDGKSLFYATGGASIARINHSFHTINNSANSFTQVDANERVWGWQAGGGGEMMITDKISLGVEYLYNRYNDGKYFVAVGQGSAPATNPFLLESGGTHMRPADQRFDFHSVRASVSYKF